MAAAIDLKQHARAWIAVTPAPMPGWPAPAGSGDAGSGQDAVHAGNGEVQPLALRQELGEVMLVETHVFGLGQFDHLLDDMYDLVLTRISDTRHLDKKAVEKALADSWTMSDADYVKRGLIDQSLAGVDQYKAYA